MWSPHACSRLSSSGSRSVPIVSLPPGPLSDLPGSAILTQTQLYGHFSLRPHLSPPLVSQVAWPWRICHSVKSNCRRCSRTLRQAHSCWRRKIIRRALHWFALSSLDITRWRVLRVAHVECLLRTGWWPATYRSVSTYASCATLSAQTLEVKHQSVSRTDTRRGIGKRKKI